MGWITDILKEVPLSAVLREKLSDVEREVTALKQENATLREENARLKLELRPPIESAGLSDIETQILILLSLERGYVMPEKMSFMLKLSPTKSDYYTSKLHDDGYISCPPLIMDGIMRFKLSQKGREYLVKNNLVQ
jgi:hypothetical protein